MLPTTMKPCSTISAATCRTFRRAHGRIRRRCRPPKLGRPVSRDPHRSWSERRGVLRAGVRMFAAQPAETTLKLHVTLRKSYGFGSMVMALLGFDNQVATFAYPGATMGAMSAAALSKASHAGEDLAVKL